MKILVDKSFERDIKKLPIKVQKQVKRIIQKLSATTSLQEVGLSKMEGAIR